MHQLTHFNKAKQELALATSIDDVKDIRDKAEALRAYTKQAGETLEMQNQCAEIKIRAERRAGELIPEQIEHGGDRKTESSLHHERLKDLDISESQSHRWQTIAKIPEEEFEKHISETMDKGEELTSVGTYKKAQKLKRQKQKDESPPLPSDKYRIIYADVPWKYSDTCEDGAIQGKGADKHYPVMSIQELCELPIIDLADDNSVLFFWVTSPILAECWPVIEAWGFTYKASFVWDKIKHNFGHYNSVRHEFLLVCTKGSCLPDNKKLYDSVISLEKTKTHSEKPPFFRELIDDLYPHGKRIELFARGEIPAHWDRWGNE